MDTLRKTAYNINLENGKHPQKIEKLLNDAGASESTVGLQIIEIRKDNECVVKFIPCQTETPVSKEFLRELHRDGLIEKKHTVDNEDEQIKYDQD